jgi:type II secretory pathway component GspD/PulD (secretin)
VRRHAGAKLAGEEVSLEGERVLPPVFRRAFTYSTQAQPLWMVANELSERTGLTVRVVNASRFDVPAAQQAATLGTNAVAIDYQGTLSGLLDTVAQRSRSYWRWSDGAIEFFEVETRTFQVNLPRGKRQVANSIKLAGAGTSQTGAASTGDTGSVSVDSRVELDMYASLVASIESLISERPDSTLTQASGSGGSGNRGGSGGGTPSGASGGSGAAGGSAENNADGAGSGKLVVGKSRVVSNPALGMITVTAAPPVMARVAQYVSTVNERFSRNIRLDVNIYNLTLNKGTNVGFSADLVYRRLRSFGLETSSQGFMQSTSTTPSSISVGVSDPSSRFNGTQLLVQALAEYGDVGLVTSGQVLAVNGQPAPLQVADDFTYLASSTTTLTPNVGATVTQTSQTQTVGLTANFTPLVLADNRIHLQYEITLSQLGRLRQIGTANSFIEAPNIVKQSLQQQAFVRDGETLVLFGYESNRAEAGGNSGITALSAKSAQTRQVTIITIQVHGGRNV